tara:strand:- start:30 stop:281 length:252 start_codon:yes stop_codon:yes gene_type:complete
MTKLTKLTKAQLIELIEGYEENKFENFKEELGMPLNTDEEWIDYIKNIQSYNAERLNESQDLLDRLKAQELQFSEYLHNTHSA